MQRLQNQKQWLMLGQKHRFEGLILTGWSRFAHATVLCEPLPCAVPSLFLCLHVLEKGTLNMKVIYSALRRLGLDGVMLFGLGSAYKQAVSLADFLEKSVFLSPRKGCKGR